jgi:hypothetical protein
MLVHVTLFGDINFDDACPTSSGLWVRGVQANSLVLAYVDYQDPNSDCACWFCLIVQ